MAWPQALAMARLGLDDLSLVETHDCFTIAELIEYEAMGLTTPGEGARAIEEGWTEKDGRLPVNPSGGLKAKGHPIGATGVSMHALAAMQLTGKAGGMQIKDAKLAGIFNMGGAAVANYVSILEPLRGDPAVSARGSVASCSRRCCSRKRTARSPAAITELAEDAAAGGRCDRGGRSIRR